MTSTDTLLDAVYAAPDDDAPRRALGEALRKRGDQWGGFILLQLAGSSRREDKARERTHGYSVYAWTDGAGTTYEPHTHDDDQSHWVLRGSLVLTVGGQEYVLGPGDRDWLPAGTVHSARVVGNAGVTYLIASRRKAGLRMPP